MAVESAVVIQTAVYVLQNECLGVFGGEVNRIGKIRLVLVKCDYPLHSLECLWALEPIHLSVATMGRRV